MEPAQTTDTPLARKSPARILLVEDHASIRKGFTYLIAGEQDFELCGAAPDLATGLRILIAQHPDLVLVDLTLGSDSGLDLIRRIRRLNTEVKILVFSMHDEDIYAGKSIEAGANGYLSKGKPPDQMITAMREVLALR